MSTTKHTPGPWHVKPMHGIGGCREICAKHRKDGLAGTAGLHDDEQDAANAALIAAAPELLEALQGAAGYLDHYIQEIGGCDHAVNICCCDEVRALEKYRALIAKAEGRS